MSRKAVLFADGGARGNPGPAAFGAVLLDEHGEVLREVGEFLGTATNNVAEWRGLLAGLEAALEEGIEELDVRLDSELVVRQITGVYRVKHPGLIEFFNRARTLMRRFDRVDVQHIRRKQNAAADRLVNLVLDDVARAKRENDVAASN